ncbi:hypothetical protein F3Y22_tig00110216pilonHSYRG00028 [Hibiscus syriacus]|uniref:Uncharacterized protein n=1 Tax=Hibiscus syriacus TaxID=106335 RepID=A0A6A3BBV7_HIBSY|nr:hypothetical protein F3Y22_tig00110216pilonHSYRG00028 [Hibiscus syriacus]
MIDICNCHKLPVIRDPSGWRVGSIMLPSQSVSAVASADTTSGYHVGRRSPCLPGDLLGRHVFPASYKRLHVPCTSQQSEAIRTSYARAVERAMGGNPRAAERAMRGHPSERARVGRPECMATYKVARRAWRPMCWDVYVPCNTFILSV